MAFSKNTRDFFQDWISGAGRGRPAKITQPFARFRAICAAGKKQPAGWGKMEIIGYFYIFTPCMQHHN
jgi:hypothetical protein